MQQLPAAFAAMANYAQFIVWLSVPRGDGKTDKFPVNPTTGEVSDAHDSTIWVDPYTAMAGAAALGPSYGLGFVLTAHDPFWFLDIDDCLTSTGWSAKAVELCERFNGAAVEVSQSGRALHLIGSACHIPPHRSKADEFDLYTSGRFVALTGHYATGDAGSDHTLALAQLVAEDLPPRETGDWSGGRDPSWNGPEDDDELLEMMLRSKSASGVFGSGITVADLWNGDEAKLGGRWPDDHGGRSYDASSADAALAQHLAFWTGKDPERMDRLMRRSELYREKWDERPDYLPRTVQGACEGQKSVLQRQEGVKAERPTDAPGATEPLVRVGYQFLSVEQQVHYFAGCVYVKDQHRVLTPDGDLLKSEQFRATYGGYVFALDHEHEKTTRSAWEAFTESLAVTYPMADSTIFLPQEAPGKLVDWGGKRCVNSYFPVAVHTRAGDPSPVLDHLCRLLPNQRDRDILLAYAAACVQHKGCKFQWAPLLQGVQGNGKTLLTRCVAKAIGDRHCHFPRASELSNKFNSWIQEKIFIGVEDVYVSQSKQEVIEELKPMITNTEQPVEKKGVDQVNAHVVANFILNSNHKDAIRKTREDRRFAPFFTAQQELEDLETAGMNGNYFPDLYDWLYKGGYEIMAHYLQTYEVPAELNPAVEHGGLMHRAPETSSTSEALQIGQGAAEQEIQEAIDTGRPGFCGGWVSSMALDRLLDAIGYARKIPVNKRREILTGMGYDWHPALTNGRVNNPVQPDNGKTRLFIRKGHPLGNLTSAKEVAARYERDQQAAAEDSNSAEQRFGGQ